MISPTISPLEAVEVADLALRVRKGDRVGAVVDGRYRTAIVLKIIEEGALVDDGLYYGVLLRWKYMLPGF